ncbi:MAG TPA: PD-(D/E)XK nuclease family protein, partial [Thermoanaerobaculia bacterium]
ILPDLAFTTTGADAVSLFTVEEPRSLVMSGRAESISGNFRFAAGEKLKKIAGQRDEAEMYRLFYVAVTRAKCELAFVCNLSEDAKTVGFLRCLFEALGTNKNDLPAMWPAAGREVQPVAINGTVVPVAFERLEIGPAGERQRRRLRDASLERQLAGGEIVELTLDAPPPVAALSSADVAKARSGSRNRASGILLHRVLEVWDLQSEVEPLLRRLAAESACDAETVARVHRYLAVVQRSPMLARLRAATTIGRELPVSGERTSRIDRLIEENGALTVIDYKSGSPDEPRLERNRDQVAAYCAHISAITARPCAGLLWYIDESSDEVVRVMPGEGA